MRGFQPGMRKDAQKNYAGGGMVSGPGTGTSDDVPAKVKVGSFVMPADTTKAVGFKPGMRDVNLSNGENVVTPEQLAAIGSAVLNLVKGATHTPTIPQESEGGKGPDHEGAESADYEMAEDVEEANATKGFFSGGGDVPEEKKAASFGDAAAAAANPAVIQVPTGQPRPGASAADQIPNSAPPGWTGGTGERVTGNEFTRNVTNTMNALAPVSGAAAPVVAGVARGFTGGAKAAAASPVVEKALAYGVPAAGFGALASAAGADQPSAAKSMRAQVAPPAATPAAGMSAPVQQETPAAMASAQSPASQPQGAQQIAPGVYRQGRGQYSDSPDGMGFKPGFTGQPTAQDNAAAQALADRSMRGFKPAGSETASEPVQPGQGLYIAPDTGGFGLLDKNRMRERELQMATTSTKSGMESQQAYESRIKGAVGALQGFQAEQAAAPRYAAEQALSGREMDLRGQEVAQRGEDLRQARGFRAGQLANDTARTALDAKRVGSDLEVRGFEVGQAKRMETLRAQYEAATDPKVRADLAQRIRVLSGKDDQANRFTVVPGGQEWDATAGVMRNVPARVLNNQTGQFVDGAGGKALPPLKDNTAAMAVVNDVSLSKEQRAAKLRELGYN